MNLIVTDNTRDLTEAFHKCEQGGGTGGHGGRSSLQNRPRFYLAAPFISSLAWTVS